MTNPNSHQPCYRLDQFGFLKVTGKDAVSFMQGYTTCDLDALDDTSVQLGAICNLQGRMLTSFLVIRQDTDLVLRMHRSLVEKTMQFLNKYIVFSKAELQDISESFRCFGLTYVSKDGQQVEREGASISVNLGNRHEIWQPEEIEDAIVQGNHWIDVEIESGLAWVDETNTEKHLPQLFAYHLLGGIDFEKGCYLGQEIVARMQYRGELKRRLHRIDKAISELESGDVIATGSKESLVILKNSTDDTIEVEIDGKPVTATPVQAN